MTENEHQRTLIQWTQAVRSKYPDLALLYHIPNEGRRDPATVNNLKTLGMKAGVPDLCLPVPRGKYGSLYIEMKTERGRPTMEQLWWIDRLNKAGAFAEICHGWESAVRVIEWYLELKEGEQ